MEKIELNSGKFNGNLLVVSLLFMFMGGSTLLRSLFPRPELDMFLIVGIPAFLVIIVFHEVLHFIPAKLYGLNPRFTWARFWGIPCPAVSHADTDSIRKQCVVSLAPQLIALACFVVAGVYAGRVVGYFGISLGFLSLYAGSVDIAQVILLALNKGVERSSV